MEPDFSLAAARHYRFTNDVIPALGSVPRGTNYPRNILVLVRHNGRIFQQIITGDVVKDGEETYETAVIRRSTTWENAYKNAVCKFPDFWIVRFESLSEYFAMDGRCRIAGSRYAPSMREAIGRAVIV